MEKPGITKGRDPYWDIVRGIAMLLVILGHSIHTALGVEDPGSRIIYTFHMPLFMLISGWFFPATLRHPTWKIVKDKFMLLILPCIICGTIDYLLDHPSGIDAKTHLIKWYGRMLNSLWFFQALFICSVFVLIGEKVFKNRCWIFYIVLFAAFFVVPDYMKAAHAKYLFPSFLAGFYIKRCNLVRLYQKYKWPLLVFSLVVFLLLFSFYTYEKGSFYELRFYIFSGIDTPATILFWDIYRIIIGFAGCMLVMAAIRLLFKRTENSAAWRGLAIYGQHTYGVYIFSTYLWLIYLNTLTDIIPIRENYGYVFALFASLTLVSYPLGVLLDAAIARIKRK